MVEGLADELSEVAVEALFTVSDIVEELELKFTSPPYDAVMECEPMAREAVVKDAWPLTRLSVVMVLPASCNVMAPDGVPEPEAGATVMVKVTPWPKTLGFADESSVTVVASLPTICESVEELGLKFVSPA